MKRRPDGRWQKKVTLPSGKSKMLYSTAATERQAIKDFNLKLLEMQAEEKNSTLFEKVADDWNTEYRESISEINYKKCMRSSYNKVIDHFSGQYIEDISSVDIKAFMNKIIKQGYSHKTVATVKSALTMIFDYALFDLKIIPQNPVRGYKLPANLPKQQRQLPTDEELAIVNAHYDGFDFLPYFLLNTGLRISEALPLTYEDIDFEKKEIRVYKHLIHDGNRPVTEIKTKSEKGTRSVILLDRVAEKMNKRGKGIIFANSSGEYYTKRQFATQWKKWKKRHNISVTAHQLRHGYATMLFEAGIDVKDVQDLMGHADIHTTHTIYTHIRNRRKADTADKLNAFSF